MYDIYYIYIYIIIIIQAVLYRQAAEKALMDAARLGRETRGGLDRFTAFHDSISQGSHPRVISWLYNHRKTIGKPWENGGFMGFDDV